MQNRLNLNDSFPAFRGAVSTADTAGGDPTIRARLTAAVHRALDGKPVDERDTLTSLYAATRDRTRELRQDGRRAEEALMIIKREVATVAADASTPDAARVAVLIQHVVRWCVAAYYAAN